MICGICSGGGFVSILLPVYYELNEQNSCRDQVAQVVCAVLHNIAKMAKITQTR